MKLATLSVIVALTTAISAPAFADVSHSDQSLVVKQKLANGGDARKVNKY